MSVLRKTEMFRLVLRKGSHLFLGQGEIPYLDALKVKFSGPAIAHAIINRSARYDLEGAGRPAAQRKRQRHERRTEASKKFPPVHPMIETENAPVGNGAVVP